MNTLKIILTGFILFFNSIIFAQGGWVQQTSNTNLDVNSVFFINNNTGYCGAEQGRILRTINGGATWQTTNLNIPQYIYSIHFPSSSTGYAVGGQSSMNGVMYKTINGGNSWTPLGGIPNNWFMGTHFINNSTGFITSWPGPVYKTINGGVTWTVSHNISTGLYSVYFPSPNTGYTCGAGGKVYKTMNQGASWVSVSPDSTSSFLLYDIHFLNDNVGVVSSANGRIWTTVNGGASWSLIYNQSGKSIVSVHMRSQNDIFASGEFNNGSGAQAMILNTLNSGTTWTQNNFSHVSFDNIIFPSASTGYAVGRNGSIYKLNDNANIVSGYMYFDQNSNNIKEITEPFISNQGVKHNNLFFPTNSQGNYTGIFNFLGNYILQPVLNNTGLNYHFHPSPQSYNITMNTFNNIAANRNFAIQPNAPATDVMVVATAVMNARPGFDLTYHIKCSNIGNQNTNTNVRFNLDNNLTFLSSVPPPSSASGNIYQYNFSFQPFEVKEFYLYLKVNTSTPLGTKLLSHALMPFDNWNFNNYDTVSQIVIGSYDPNDKQVQLDSVITPTQIARGDSLDYTIRFQNTGTADAINIVVRDTISSNLDLSTFQFLSSSHPCEVSIENQRELVFTFENIHLPDSNTNEPQSHGYIRYRIKPLNTLQIGNIIRNTAYIFFDFNEPIITNTTYNIVDNLVAVTTEGNIVPDKFCLNQNYPNPFNPSTKIKFSVASITHIKLTIYDILGREKLTLVNQDLNPGYYSVDFDAQHLSTGVYFYKLESESFTETKKMILIK